MRFFSSYFLVVCVLVFVYLFSEVLVYLNVNALFLSFCFAIERWSVQRMQGLREY